MTCATTYLVSELLETSPSALPLQIRELYDAGRVVLGRQAMVLHTESGARIVLSPKDVLMFRDGEPYALVHLH